MITLTMKIPKGVLIAKLCLISSVFSSINTRNSRTSIITSTCIITSYSFSIHSFHLSYFTFSSEFMNNKNSSIYTKKLWFWILFQSIIRIPFTRNKKNTNHFPWITNNTRESYWIILFVILTHFLEGRTRPSIH